MGTREKSQYQCVNCGTLSWIEDPPDIDENELYIEMKCKHCHRMTKHLWVGDQPEDKYIYYDVTKDSRFY